VLKEPKLWPLLFDVLGVVSTDLVTPAGFDGDVIKARRQRHGMLSPPGELAQRMRELKQIFKACGLCYAGMVGGCKDAWALFDALDVFLKQATGAIDGLDERLVAVTSGGRAAQVFGHLRRFSDLSLPGRSKAAMKAASRVASKGKECNRCHEVVYGSFYDHQCRPTKAGRTETTSDQAPTDRSGNWKGRRK